MDSEENRKLIYLYSRQCVDSFVLPAIAEGSYWLYKSVQNKKERVIEIIGKQSQWYFVQNNTYRFVPVKTMHVVIGENTTYTLMGDLETILLMIQPYQKKLQIFQPYEFPKNLKITIGRDKKNVIQYNQKWISMLHVSICFHQKGWHLSDCDSKNGVYVNKLRVNEKDLVIGDSVQMMGLHILVGPDCFFLHEQPQVHLSDCICIKQLPGSLWREKMKSTLVYGAPEAHADFQKKEYIVDGPPSPFHHEQMPLIYVMGPSITMGLSSITMGMFACYQALNKKGDILQVIPSLIMAVSMALGTIVWPLLAKHYEGKQHRQQENLRHLRYTEYLQQLDAEIQNEIKAYELYLRMCYPTLTELMETLETKPQKIWSRTKDRDLFMSCSMGIGTLPYDVSMTHERSGFQIHEDVLEERMEQLVKFPYKLHDVPYILNLLEKHCVAFIGKATHCEKYLLSLLYQIAILHNYEEVKLIVLLSEQLARTNGILWIPHLFNEDRSIRFMVCNDQDGKQINSILEDILEDPLGLNCSYIVFSFTADLEKRMPILKKIRRKEVKVQVSYLQACESEYHVNKECDEIFFVNEDSITHNGQSLSWKPITKPLLMYAKILANCYLLEHKDYLLPEMYTFLDMYNCGTVEQLNIWHRWQYADVIHSLEVPIGITKEGESMVLDVHEKYHGPHGLIAGMTGSGKSECIMTYILSLAVNFSPLEVSFLLIDYKGGTMAQAFESLPHTAGIITNLNGETLQRSLASIKSELTKRQHIFLETCKQKNIHHLDIYSYQGLRREDATLYPMSHLFIIADEFAELKAQQPEFMEQLKQSARIGRSLGIHLILATQKPAGIVDDQIWSNSRFHICLKVQDHGDSHDMLKKEDAAYLKKVGQGYLQIGNDEVYEKGLFAFAQSGYEPKERYQRRITNEIAILDHSGQHIYKKGRRSKVELRGTQLDHIVSHIQDLAIRTGYKALPLWKKPISNTLKMHELYEKYPAMSAMVGEIDDVFHQSQYPFQFPVHQLQHTLIYGMGNSGKTMFLFSMLFSWMKSCKSGDVLVYLFDFDDKQLGIFKEHYLIGDVMFCDDREKVDSFFFQIQKELKRRKDNQEKSIPYCIIFHNYENFCAEYSEWEEILTYIVREGEKYQLYFLITLNSLNGISYRLSQYFKYPIVFQMKESSDYHALLPNEHHIIPQTQKGSGILKQKEVLQFQIALCEEEEIRQCPVATEVEKKHRIPLLPKHIKNKTQKGRRVWYLGKSVIDKGNIYHTFSPSSIVYVFAYRIPAYMEQLHLQDIIDHHPNVFVVSPQKIIHQHEEVSADDILQYSDTTLNNLYVWRQFPKLATIYGQAWMQSRIQEKCASHLFIDDVSLLSQYTSFDWFTSHLLDAKILWIGKGIQECCYTLKITQQGLRNDIASNRAYLWEDGKCIELQLWEEEENG